MNWDSDELAAHSCQARMAATMRELTALLQRAEQWRLTVRQSTDLDDILAELEAGGGRCALVGDLRILDATARWSPTTDAAWPASAEQRLRIDALVSVWTRDTEVSPGSVERRRRWWSTRRTARVG
jgi:hypothetical protein